MVKILCNLKFNFMKKVFWACFFIALGAASTLAFQHIANAEEKSPKQKIIDEMEAIENKMNKSMEENDKLMKQLFEDMPKNSRQSEVRRSEDDDNYIYELTFSGFEKNEVTAEIKNNALTFAGKKTNKKDEQNLSATNFYYTFSLPKYDLKNDPEINKEEGKITVKLRKKK